MPSDPEDCTAVGKLFHTWAAVELNARPPMVTCSVRGTSSMADDDDNQRCSPVGAGRWGNVAPCCAKNCQPEGDTFGHSQPMQFLEQWWHTHDQTSDVGKLVAELHTAPTAACQVERQAVPPVWRCRSRASSAPMPRQVTARLDLTQIAGCCEAVSTLQNSSKQSLRRASSLSDWNLGRFPGRNQHALERLWQSWLPTDFVESGADADSMSTKWLPF